MSRRLRLLYPFLFAILPVLLIINRNPGASSSADDLAVVVAMLVGCAVLYLLVALLAKRQLWNPIVPLIVFASIIWFYWYDTIIGLSHRAWRALPSSIAAIVGLVLTILVLSWLQRRPRYLERLTSFLGLTGVLLVGWSGVKIIRSKIAERQEVRRSALAAEFRRPIPAPAGAHRGPERDVYLILLDEYANSGVLRDVFGFDNREFEDSLRQLGFTIPRETQSNYIHTMLSLPSLLNFGHLTRLTDELGARSNDPTLPDYLLENNRTVAFLKSRGYRFLFFPSQWWISTQSNRNADWTYQAWTGFDLGRAATRSDLRRSLVNTTALNLLQKNYAYDADHVTRTLLAMEEVPKLPEATFAFAHVLSPHRPYAVHADCTPREERVPLGGPWVPRRRQIYIEQLQCVNHLVSRVVTELLRRSTVPPIIIIQGDHGTPTLGYDKAPNGRSVAPAQARERFGAFGAYYLPDGGGQAFADSVTLVNVFQKILSYYFGADIPPSQDRLFFSMDETPFNFVEFDRNRYVPLPARTAISTTTSQTHQTGRRGKLE
jgi:sulfatase-like protein